MGSFIKGREREREKGREKEMDGQGEKEEEEKYTVPSYLIKCCVTLMVQLVTNLYYCLLEVSEKDTLVY